VLGGRSVEGYRYKSRAGDQRRSNPLFHRERGGSERIFTFIDLVEILFVKTFIDQGVSMRTIRLVQSEAAEEFKSVTPSASRSSKRTMRPSSNDSTETAVSTFSTASVDSSSMSLSSTRSLKSST
jgi:DNA-binding transcriptional MerR regulator